MITTIIMILITILIIGFIWGGFIALTVTVLSILIGYFLGLYGILGTLIVIATASGIYKYKFSKKI